MNLFFDRCVLAMSPDGEKAGCHLCGRWFAHLGAHVSRTHKMTPTAYKQIAGLMEKTGLISRALADKRRTVAARVPAMNDRVRSRESMLAIPPEERSRRASTRRISEEELRARHPHMIAMRQARTVAAISLSRVKECRRCQTRYVQYQAKKGNQYYCSQACYWAGRGDSTILQAQRERKRLEHRQRPLAPCRICGGVIADKLCGSHSTRYKYLRIGVCSHDCLSRVAMALRGRSAGSEALADLPQ